MKQYRITKYNPALRDKQGKFLGEEWTEFGDVGKLVNLSEYERIESAYINIVIKILTEQQIESIHVSGLEDSKGLSSLKDGQTLRIDEIEKVIRSILRGDYWARLETEKAFIHFGWDFYMYVGNIQISEGVKVLANETGLYIEPFISPYNV